MIVISAILVLFIAIISIIVVVSYQNWKQRKAALRAMQRRKRMMEQQKNQQSTNNKATPQGTPPSTPPSTPPAKPPMSSSNPPSPTPNSPMSPAPSPIAPSPIAPSPIAPSPIAPSSQPPTDPPSGSQSPSSGGSLSSQGFLPPRASPNPASGPSGSPMPSQGSAPGAKPANPPGQATGAAKPIPSPVAPIAPIAPISVIKPGTPSTPLPGPQPTKPPAPITSQLKSTSTTPTPSVSAGPPRPPPATKATPINVKPVPPVPPKPTNLTGTSNCPMPCLPGQLGSCSGCPLYGGMNNLIIMPGLGGASIADLTGKTQGNNLPNVPTKLSLPCDQENETSRKKFLAMYPDVAHKGIDPWDYYISQGRKEKKTWPGPECPSLRWSSYPRCTMPFNKSRPGMKKDAIGRWTGIDPKFGNRTCRYMYEETLVNGLPYQEAPVCPLSNVDKIWIGSDKHSWGHVADNDYDCEYSAKLMVTASNKCPSAAVKPSQPPPVIKPTPAPVIKPAIKPAQTPPVKPASAPVVKPPPVVPVAKPKVAPVTAGKKPPPPLCSKPFSATDPTIAKYKNLYMSINDQGKACMFNQTNGLPWQKAPKCPPNMIKQWTANGYKWGRARDAIGEYDCQDTSKPLQCTQMASALGNKVTYNGKQYFSGREKDGRDCVFLSHLRTPKNHGAIVNTTPQCDSKAIGFEEDASKHFWGWDEAKKRKCIFRNAK